MEFKHFWIVFAAIFLANFCFSATISGNVYDAMNLEILPSAVIDINSSPAQQIVAREGNYSVNLPLGDYSIHAFYYVGDLKLVADENISIAEEGDFVLDLILFPQVNGQIDENIPVGSGGTTSEVPQETPLKFFGFDMFQLSIIVLLLALVSAAAILVSKKQKENAHFIGQEKPPNLPAKEEISLPATQFPASLPVVEEKLDKYALEVLDVLKRSGNRLTQKELCEKVSSVGEAKISLIVSELEALGKVKKIKKGRGNIIILKV